MCRISPVLPVHSVLSIPDRMALEHMGHKISYRGEQSGTIGYVSRCVGDWGSFAKGWTVQWGGGGGVWGWERVGRVQGMVGSLRQDGGLCITKRQC